MEPCDPRDIAIKSFFLGPQSENGDWLRGQWSSVLDNWITWRKGLFPNDGCAISSEDQASPAFSQALEKIQSQVTEMVRRLEGENPKFSPRYIGHMISEISLPAFIGHVAALLHNPNLTSREVSQVVSRLEEEAIADLAQMLKFPRTAHGHFTSGGTMANFEALWRAIQRADLEWGDRGLLNLGPWAWAEEYRRKYQRKFSGFVVMVPGNKHYSWEKAVTLMGLGINSFCSVELDSDGRLSVEDLEKKIAAACAAHQKILMVVSVAGTTELGEVDPIDRVQDLVERYREEGLDLWHHVDGAYGSYFASMLDRGELESELSPSVAHALRAIGRADSVTLDPHKLGYVPYACGAFIARDETHYRGRAFSADYLKSDNDSRWMHTLEGSRSGAGVTATWLSNRTLGLGPDGYGRLLSKGIEARQNFAELIATKIQNVIFVHPADLNILCFSFGSPGEKLSDVNLRTQEIIDHFSKSPNFSVSKTVLRAKSYKNLLQKLVLQNQLVYDCDHWLQVRLVLMNPFLMSKETKARYIAEFVEELGAVLAATA